MIDKTLDAEKLKLLMELRRSGIDTKLLSIIERTPREAFVPDYFFRQAYDNIAIAIGQGQTISQPKIVAEMIQELEVGERMKVLEIGTGSGYMTAILAKLCRRVYTIERIRELLIDAQMRFEKLHIRNVTTLIADGTKGWPDQAPFDRIIASAVASEPPQALLEQLSLGGILIIPIGEVNGDQWVMKYKRLEDGFESTQLWPVRFVPLVDNNAKPAQQES
jgi:protein-L-isoaspartate(D-aspartate) O-methyltransferase